MKKTSFWIVLIALIVAVSAGVLLWQHLAKKDAVIAEIYVEGSVSARSTSLRSKSRRPLRSRA